ncbi:uncharacterized protein TRIADDRAFT_60700 [Trichoplax adhaerens]|uniref:NOA1/YqeH-like C-terminal domain-containing protein n=1 Tax=Trichoplax adhaerens TaxID=10228 RepID=B3S951_TRIAD|nr:hypothetical protein TRIADDRAFT_60700 [Trichoplax adhaerens]EDV20812.1 hypothetical protein TRIADDRAFT_60700 [Trichoplax adhaerens]|eukprot:XP_002116753.1 hypothetical protein TRIADDRAFT_60700 [Trichoplax adhaerens]
MAVQCLQIKIVANKPQTTTEKRDIVSSHGPTTLIGPMRTAIMLRNRIGHAWSEYSIPLWRRWAQSSSNWYRTKTAWTPAAANLHRLYTSSVFPRFTTFACGPSFRNLSVDVFKPVHLIATWCNQGVASIRYASSEAKTSPNHAEKLVDLHGKRCPGCGSIFHSRNEDKFGYILQRKLVDVPASQVSSIICQRCFCLNHYNQALNMNAPEDDWRNHIQKIPKDKCIVMLVVDIFDFPGSIFPNLLDIIGYKVPILLIANKMDVLLEDGPGHIERIQTMVWEGCKNAGLTEGNLVDICLVSARKNQGIKEVVDKVLQHRPPHGDIFLLGCTNVGKSSLFKSLLDYLYDGKPKTLMRYPTISVWPGTTIGLLRYPIRKKINNLGRRAPRRIRGLKNQYIYESPYLDDSKHDEESKLSDISTVEGDDIMLASHDGVLTGWNHEGDERGPFFYDTPGAMSQNMYTDLLNTRDLSKVLPLGGITPRTLRLQPSQSIFLAGLGRIDYIEGPSRVYFTFFASRELPLHICQTMKADDIYDKHFGYSLLKIPNNMNKQYQGKSFPRLQGKEFTFKCHNGWKYSSADILLSSAGFAAITAGLGDEIKIKAYTPNGLGLILRRPSVMPYSVNWKGKPHGKKQGYYKGLFSRQKMKEQFPFIQSINPYTDE